MVVAISPPVVVKKSVPLDRIFRFTAKEYNRLTDIGFFTTEHRVELLDGWLVTKMPQKPPHATSLDLLDELLTNNLPKPWTFRTQRPIVVSGENVPEPDLVIVEGPEKRFFKRHPTAADIAIIVEVSDSTLEQDRGVKRTIYAENRLPEYWIVNLIEKQFEVYSQPRSGKVAAYRKLKIYGLEDSVPITLNGKWAGEIPVAELLQK